MAVPGVGVDSYVISIRVKANKGRSSCFATFSLFWRLKKRSDFFGKFIEGSNLS